MIALISEGGKSTLDGLGQGMLIGVFNIHTHGNAAGQTRDIYTLFLQLIDEIGGGGLARHRGAGGDEHLFDHTVFGPGQEFPCLDLFRAYAVDGGEDTVQNVIVAAIYACFLDGYKIAGLFDDADEFS